MENIAISRYFGCCTNRDKPI